MPKAELERVTSVLLPLSPIAAKPARIKSTRDRFLKSKAMRKNLKVCARACPPPRSSLQPPVCSRRPPRVK